MRRKGQAGGFTLIEVLAGLVILIGGIMGAMAVYTAAVRTTAGARDFDYARTLAAELMEQTRGKSVAALEAADPDAVPDVVSAKQIAYHRDYTVSPVSGEANLVMVTAEVWFAEDGNDADHRTVRLQMLRTRQETF